MKVIALDLIQVQRRSSELAGEWKARRNLNGSGAFPWGCKKSHRYFFHINIILLFLFSYVCPVYPRCSSVLARQDVSLYVFDAFVCVAASWDTPVLVFSSDIFTTLPHSLCMCMLLIFERARKITKRTYLDAEKRLFDDDGNHDPTNWSVKSNTSLLFNTHSSPVFLNVNSGSIQLRWPYEPMKSSSWWWWG